MNSPNKFIYKYSLGITYYQKILMPHGARFLSVQDQNGILTMWALVDPDNALFEYNFSIVGTGDLFPKDPGVFLGTVQQGCMVWHVFGNILPY